MKTLKQHINEALKIGKNLSEWSSYSCQPKTKDELKKIIEDRIEKEGPECDLNDIDTILITDMSWIFVASKFNGDISKWNVSNVKDMSCMFHGSAFNGDISGWDVSSVEDMDYMFFCSFFDQPIGDWDVRKVKNMDSMFKITDFNQDISNWKINKDCDTTNMFDDCPIRKEYKPVLPE